MKYEFIQEHRKRFPVSTRNPGCFMPAPYSGTNQKTRPVSGVSPHFLSSIKVSAEPSRPTITAVEYAPSRRCPSKRHSSRSSV